MVQTIPHYMRRLLLIITLLALAQGCELFGDEEEQGVFLETDRTRYEVQDTVLISFHNRTGLQILIGVCDLWFQQLNEEEWERVISPVLDIRACPSIVIPIDPGTGGLVTRRAIEPWMKVGTYRLEYQYFVENELIERQPGDLLDMRYVYSEPIKVFEPVPIALDRQR